MLDGFDLERFNGLKKTFLSSIVANKDNIIPKETSNISNSSSNSMYIFICCCCCLCCIISIGLILYKNDQDEKKQVE